MRCLHIKLIFSTIAALCALTILHSPIYATIFDLEINAISPVSQDDTDWIEIINTDGTERLDLSEFQLTYTNRLYQGTQYQDLIQLEGTLKPKTTKKILLPSESQLLDQGGCVTLNTPDYGAIYSLVYGAGRCDNDTYPLDLTHVKLTPGAIPSQSDRLVDVPDCPKYLPSGTTYIFNDETTSTMTKLFLKPATEPLTHYLVSYGTSSNQYTKAAAGFHDHNLQLQEVIIPDLKPDTSYFFRARAANGCALGPWSNEKEIRTKPVYTPRTPTPKPVHKNGRSAAQILGMKKKFSPTPEPTETTSPTLAPSTPPPPTSSTAHAKTNIFQRIWSFFVNVFGINAKH